MSVYSLQVEKHCLGGLIKHQEVFADVMAFISQYDFFNNIHRVIFGVVRDILVTGEKVDEVLLAAKIKNMGISFKDDVNIYEYIKNICFSEITAKGTLDAFKELLKLRICREIFETGNKLQAHAKSNINKELDEIIAEADAIYNGKISAYETKNEPENLFEKIEEIIDARGNNPVDDIGYLTPFPVFNERYGGLRPKNVYAVVARPGQGKTTFLFELAFGCSKATNFGAKVLYLDTEMESEDMQMRAVAAETGVPMWELETGNWRKNPESSKRITEAMPRIKKFICHHYKVGNKSTEQVSSIARRWFYSKVGRGGKAIIVYDYFKITTERTTESWKETQVLGEKVDRFKKLGEELGCPILSAMQLNRFGEESGNKGGGNSSIVDDASAIAASDRLLWFASYIAILRRKTVDELAFDTPNFGTHKLINLKQRFQGRNGCGHMDVVKRLMADGTQKYVRDYLNFKIANFRVEERGSLIDIINASTKQISVPQDHSHSNDGDSSL